MRPRRGIGKGLSAAVVVVVAVIVATAVFGFGGKAASSTYITSSDSSTRSLPTIIPTSIPYTTPTVSSTSSSISAPAGSASETSTVAVTSATTGTPEMILSDLGVNVNGTGFGNLNDNDSEIMNNSFYIGEPGVSFNVEVSISYGQCTDSCPTEVTAVSVEEPGFTVIGTTPGLPVASSDMGTHGVAQQFMFTVNVQPPSTPYNGPLDILCQVSK